MLLRPRKLRMPELSPSWIERIDAALLFSRGTRVVAVTAGPGFGKTVLAVQIAAGWRGPVLWYSCDRDDADFAVFAAHLAHLCGGDTAAITASPDPQETGLAALEALAHAREALVVFDDVQFLRGRPAQALREFVTRGSAAGLSFVLCGRELPLPAHELASRGGFVMVSATDLAFDVERSRCYLDAAFAGRLAPDRIDELVHDIEGWPAGLALAAAVPARDLHGRSPAHAASLDMLFDYLAAEVLESLDPAERRFLLETSILDTLEVDLCNAVAGTNDATSRLAGLTRRGLFIVRVGNDAFVPHRLFRAFLRDRLTHEYPAVAVAALHDRAARVFAQRGDDLTAIEHQVAASNLELAAQALAPLAASLIAGGQAGRLDRVLHAVGAARVAADPLLSVARGRLQQAAGTWDEALATLASAAILARAGGLADVAADAVRAMAPMLAARGERERLGALLDGVLALPLSEAKRATISVSLGAFLLDGGRFDEVLELYARIGPAVAQLDDLAVQGVMLHNTGAAHMRRGDPFAALGCYERALAVKRAARQRVSTLLTLGNLCVALRALGDVAAARVVGSECLTGARRIGDATMLAHALENAGALALFDGDLDTAAARFEEARAACDPGDAVFLPDALHGIARVALQRGDVGAGSTACARAITLLHGEGDAQRRAAVLVTRARIAVAAGEAANAATFLRAAFAIADGPDVLAAAAVHFDIAAVAAAAAEAAAGDADEVRNVARRAAAIAFACSASRDYAFLERTHGGSIAAARALLAVAPQPGIALRIALLGSMRVVVRGVDVDASAWKRRKAREVFAYLVLERGRLVPRARLVDVFWPDADADSAGDNLRVVISAVRRAVGDVIRFESGGYRFIAPPLTAVDVDRFDAAMTSARNAPDAGAALDAYADALDACGGDLLDGFEEGVWQLAARARYRDDALEAARALVTNAATPAGVRARAVDRLLGLAPFDIDAVRIRLDRLAEAKRVGEAHAEYERWRRRYTETFAEPAPQFWHPPVLAIRSA